MCLFNAYNIAMRNTLTDGERDILAELEKEAREGMQEQEIPEGHESCDWCSGQGQVLNHRHDDLIPCDWCEGKGYSPILPEPSPEAERGMARALAIIKAEIDAQARA